MFKVLPQMHRLVAQVCETYGVGVAEVIVDTEGVIHHTDGRDTHQPYYIVKLAPNERGWLFISCRPRPGRYCDYSASQNNVTVVIYPHSAHGAPFVIPSWRGKIVPPFELHRHQYHIDRGYMTLQVETDLTERRLIQEYFRTASEA